MARIDLKNSTISFCFGCKKVSCNSDAQHYLTCKKWQQHKEKIAQLLAIEDEAPAVENNGEEIEKLKREWALEKTNLLNANEKLKKEIKEIEQAWEEDIKYSQLDFTRLLKLTNTTNRDEMEEAFENP